MTDFSDRRRGEEAKAERDEMTMFRITARRNRLLGEWAAGKLDLSAAETEAYAKAVVQADFEEAGDEDVIRKVYGDLIAAGVEVDEAAVRTALDQSAVEARRQLIGKM
ncbi:DUF1476 domain-containing protein [Croceicoccus sp. F390]|uniref:DUF1476 domain-containing protein n=1 Tax=Croceicoccus esteveae TaxID=3075597 RepID=A0ABU2ZHK7_9SPHN|nr:DUF1476 domain-containing protein [Croceicoccus sp. F390]MDT0576084.1 DUF1476 domain-containing protein [Croceicoccus sp. F390]